MSIKVVRFNKHQSGALYGFADITIPVFGTLMGIKGCKVWNKNGRAWMSLPDREYKDAEGNSKYAPLITIEDEGVFKQLSAGLTKAWEEYAATISEPVQQPSPPVMPEEGCPF